MKKKMFFSKYHGLGNDFILVNSLDTDIDIKLIKQHVTKLCDRRYGIGADGVVLLLPSDKCDLRMVIINSDGTEPEMCGNGMRCIAHFVQDFTLFKGKDVVFETLAGDIYTSVVQHSMFSESLIKVNMGSPKAVSSDSKAFLSFKQLFVDEVSLDLCCVSMGNPHAVCFVNQLSDINLEKVGKFLQEHDAFPNGVNFEIAEIISRNQIKVQVWERGVGLTLACGTGACATFFAALKQGLVETTAEMVLPGGSLTCSFLEETNEILMTGASRFVFTGKISL